MKIKELGEFGLIERIKTGTIIMPENIIAGIGDDAAVIRNRQGYVTLVSTDMMVENIHFSLSTTSPRNLGYKALAVNVSDIAAMGGIPDHALISIGLRPELPVTFADELYKGLRECCRRYGVNIIGGDTVSSPKAVVINVVILGHVEEELCLYRSTARPGDVLMVTGDLGGSSAGLDTLLNPRHVPSDILTWARNRHYRPEARVEEIRAALSLKGITSADDISDGLASEIIAVTSASKVGAVIEADKIPVASQTKHIAAIYGKDYLDYALYGGEDFEILLTCKNDKVLSVQKTILSKCSTPVTPIGTIVPAEEGITIIRENKRMPLIPGGYNHFQ